MGSKSDEITNEVNSSFSFSNDHTHRGTLSLEFLKDRNCNKNHNVKKTINI